LAYLIPVIDTLSERIMFQAVILAENLVYVLLRLAKKPTANFLKPVENQKNYSLGAKHASCWTSRWTFLTARHLLKSLSQWHLALISFIFIPVLHFDYEKCCIIQPLCWDYFYTC